ncbi:MAG: DNA polymerase III subunit delta [Candidatus Margulisiibacteriota bacterium]
MANQVFLFYGDEDLLIKERINELKKSIADPSLNVEQIDGEDPDLEKIVSALQTQSLFFGSKLLIIKNADLKSKEWEAAIPALKTVSPGITVIFWAAAVDRRSKIFKLIDEIGEVYEFRSFAAWEQDQVVSWIRQRVKASGKEIDNSAAMRLQEVCGNSLMKLSSEIDKLITYIGDGQQITPEDVCALASPGQISVFALSDAVADKNVMKSLSAFRTLQRNKIELFPILSMLANRYRIMLMGKSINDPMKIAQTLKASPNYVKKCLGCAGKFTPEELKKNLELLLETDLKLKSGEQQLPAFELLLTSLCSG